MTDSAATEMGTLIQKHHCMKNERYKEQSCQDSIYKRTRQPTFWASAPPTIGPTAKPTEMNPPIIPSYFPLIMNINYGG